MSDDRQPDVIGSLPSTRPHRRSAKRAPASEAGATPAAKTTRTAKPKTKRAAKPESKGAPKPRPPAPERAVEPTSTPGALQTAVEAAVELTEIGLRFGAQTLRSALSRLPRP